MAQNKKHITSDNITEWLCSTGFLVPRNETELARFDKIYGDNDYGLTDNELDPGRIIKGLSFERKNIELSPNIKPDDFSTYKMAARNGNALPKHIVDKIKKNQGPKNDGIKA
jgi:hypothetical protein